ncbi:HAUS augmin-like complex subunit 1 isoform X1 [Macrobrachium rosenbergii]|uniref:HAUS augmin-like complex subunit 1 isoform X1 n=2 Tax=Macrobrachium rosenbergii TaxID=79674 RepID=UPI0034D5E6DD
MDIKHREVVQWLQEIYGEERIPLYEKTERSITILYKLMKECKRAESQARILTEDYTRKAAEYNAEAQQLQKWRETAKLDPSQLTPENQKSLQALAQTANILDIQTPSSTNIILAMNQLEMEHMQIASELEQEKSRTAYLLEANKDLSKKLQDIKIITKQAEATWKLRQEELAKDAKWKQFTEKKCKNYEADINRFEAKLSQVGLTKEITHGNISAEWARLQTLEEEIKTLEKQLRSYTLPPDMSLAELKVQEARQELATLIEKFSENFNTDVLQG